MTWSDRNERKRETAGHITTECNKKNGTETKKKEEKENKRNRKMEREREEERGIPNGEWWSLSICSAAQAVSFGHSIIQSFG